jgi:secreted trypsin-like serine protease
MKNIFYFTVAIFFSISTFSLDSEIIRGVEGDMDGTGPHMVYISSVSETITKTGMIVYERRGCSGTLITSHIVMTAAHCFGLNASEISKITFSTIYFTLDKNKSMNVFVTSKKFRTHPQFNTNVGYLDNDIALIYFPEQLPKGYRPVDYQKTDDTFLLGKDFRVAGYGQQLDHSNPNAHTTFIGKLMSTKLKFDTAYPSASVFSTHLSAEQTTTGVCSGDSGGAALVRDSNMQFKVVGINSSAGSTESCLNGKSYFTRVSLFTDWIAETIKELSK